MRIIRTGSRIQDLRKGNKIGARCAKDSRTATMRHPVPLLIILAPMPAVDCMFSELIHDKAVAECLDFEQEERRRRSCRPRNARLLLRPMEFAVGSKPREWDEENRSLVLFRLDVTRMSGC